jgi:hypothetical protein
MFANETTEKVPCWKCRKFGECKIQEGICAMPYQAAKHLRGLTFVCDEFELSPSEDNKCPKCGRDGSPRCTPEWDAKREAWESEYRCNHCGKIYTFYTKPSGDCPPECHYLPDKEDCPKDCEHLPSGDRKGRGTQVAARREKKVPETRKGDEAAQGDATGPLIPPAPETPEGEGVGHGPLPSGAMGPGEYVLSKCCGAQIEIHAFSSHCKDCGKAVSPDDGTVYAREPAPETPEGKTDRKSEIRARIASGEMTTGVEEDFTWLLSELERAQAKLAAKESVIASFERWRVKIIARNEEKKKRIAELEAKLNEQGKCGDACSIVKDLKAKLAEKVDGVPKDERIAQLKALLSIQSGDWSADSNKLKDRIAELEALLTEAKERDKLHVGRQQYLEAKLAAVEKNYQHTTDTLNERIDALEAENFKQEGMLHSRWEIVQRQEADIKRLTDNTKVLHTTMKKDVQRYKDAEAEVERLTAIICRVCKLSKDNCGDCPYHIKPSGDGKGDGENSDHTGARTLVEDRRDDHPPETPEGKVIWLEYGTCCKQCVCYKTTPRGKEPCVSCMAARSKFKSIKDDCMLHRPFDTCVGVEGRIGAWGHCSPGKYPFCPNRASVPDPEPPEGKHKNCPECGWCPICGDTNCNTRK